MKLLIIRHADPDYEIDSLTEAGHREARLLADWFLKQSREKGSGSMPPTSPPWDGPK